MFIVFAAVVIILVLLFYLCISKPHRFPPGPVWYPFLGCYLHFQKRSRCLKFTYRVFEELSRIYGNVIGLKLGRTLVVCASGWEAIHEVISNEDFNGRPDGFFFQVRTFNKRLGIVFTDGEDWEVHRKFSLQHLKTFGFGRKEMEMKIAEETAEFVQMLRNTYEKTVEVKTLFDIGVVNVLWAMIAGRRIDHNDARLGELLSVMHDAFNDADPTGGLLNQVPALRHIVPGLCGYNRLMHNHRRLWHFFEETIKEHRKTYCNLHCRDLIDAYIEKIDCNFSKSYSDEQLLAVCMDLFMAGSETTNNSMAFATRFLIQYPEIQRKLQAELDNTIGKNRCATLQDKANLPYLNAFVMEVMRISNVPPLSIPRRAMQDTKLLGYHVPEGTLVVTNLYSVHMDPVYWKDPKEFRPERFLDHNGKVTAPEKYYMPFGFGKRRCIGESLAKSNIFLFLTAIMCNFTVEMDPDQPITKYDSEGGFTLSPTPFCAIFKSRTH